MPETSQPSATTDTGYRPTVTAAYAEQVRRWHEGAYRSARAAGRSGQTFDYLGLTLHVPPEVMPITPVSDLLGKAVLAEVRTGDRVLDMGTGSGVNAILAASKATEVLAVDVNPRAVDAARQNAAGNGVADRIEVRHSDVFSAVDGEFDLMIFDPPFRWFAARTLLEMASTDENYRALTTFVRNAGRYLRTNGRMLIFFGTSGDLGYLQQLRRRGAVCRAWLSRSRCLVRFQIRVCARSVLDPRWSRFAHVPNVADGVVGRWTAMRTG